MKLLLLGHSGKLGKAFKSYLTKNAHQVSCLNSLDFDASDPETLSDYLLDYQADVVINCVALNGLARCVSSPALAFAVNSIFPKWLAQKSKDLDFKLIHFSTESVFSDQEINIFNEESLPSPRSVYAVTKLAGEFFVSAHTPNYHIIRLPILFGDSLDSPQVIEGLIGKAMNHQKVWVNENLLITPTYVYDIPEVVMKKVLPSSAGIYHLRNEGQLTLRTFLEKIFTALDQEISFEEVRPDNVVDSDFRENRVILNSKKINNLRNIDSAIADYVATIKNTKIGNNNVR